MKNTYLNDAYSSTYPFVADAVLPFPMHCIVGAGVCLRYKHDYGYEPGVYPSVYVSNIEFTSTGMTASISLDSVQAGICTFTASIQKPAVLSTDDWDVLLWIVPGMIDEQSIGTYNTTLKLDPVCIHYISVEAKSKFSRIYINDEEYNVDEQLTIETSGLINMLGWEVNEGDELNPDLIGNTDFKINAVDKSVNLWISGNPDAVLSVAPTAPYDMVRSINGIPVDFTEDNDYSRKLTFNWVWPENDTDSKPYIKFFTSSQLTWNNVFKFTADANAAISADMFNDYGTSIILSINGTGKIPNCYAGDDDADTNLGDL